MTSSRSGAPHPYIPATAADRARMLERIGVADLDALFADLPAAHRDPAITLPPALTEPELLALLSERAAANAPPRPHFLGAGAYRRFIPALVPYLVSRSEFATAYTPYQPEISQGTLQSGFEFQSVVCELTGLDVANTGLYDVASATAEACLLAARFTKRRAVALLEPLHPGTVEVVRTYARGSGLRVDLVSAPPDTLDALDTLDDYACLVVQQPDFLGTIRDLEPIAAHAHAHGALLVAAADPFALGLLRAPGDAGADIVTGEGRDLAGPPAFGGPSLGLFAARSQFMRQMPGRIVGQTQELPRTDSTDSADSTGSDDRPAPRTGYVLTLQAREQFIRRERATSNVSTAQALIALAFTITLQALGPHGLRESAELCYQRAHDAARRIAQLPGYEIPDRGPWFQEFLLRGLLPAADLRHRLAERGITAGLDVSNRPEPDAQHALLFAVTEATPDAHIDTLIDALTQIGREA